MQTSHVRLLIVVLAVLFVSVATADRRVVLVSQDGAVPGAAPAAELVAGEIDEAARAAEIARIRTHLMQVEEELLSADVRHLSLAQRENRAHHIQVLRAYRNRGVFPHNHQVAGQPVPVFIDEHGTHCAVGFLIAQSGHEALARRIAAERNLARVRELVDIPELVEWLEDAGLSVHEAARIQPAYGWPGPGEPERVTTSYPTYTAINAAVGGASIVWNALADRHGDAWWAPGAAGVGAGAGGLAVALIGAGLRNDASDIEGGAIVANAGVGLLAGFLGVRTLALGRAAAEPLGAEPAPQNRGAPTLQLASWAPPEGGAGVRVGLRF
jgi:hypothetical protein